MSKPNEPKIVLATSPRRRRPRDRDENPLSLSGAFSVYWDDMKLCRDAKAYWCLLHVTVCLPDICAALQARDGEAKPVRYKRWCNKYLKGTLLNGAERWRMRCKVLHQGRSTTDWPNGKHFAFVQPSPTRINLHGVVKAGRLHVDVGRLADETKLGVDSWIAALEADSRAAKARNVARNLPTLVCVNDLKVVMAPNRITVVGPAGTTRFEEIATILTTSSQT